MLLVKLQHSNKFYLLFTAFSFALLYIYIRIFWNMALHFVDENIGIAPDITVIIGGNILLIGFWLTKLFVIFVGILSFINFISIKLNKISNMMICIFSSITFLVHIGILKNSLLFSMEHYSVTPDLLMGNMLNFIGYCLTFLLLGIIFTVSLRFFFQGRVDQC